MLMRGKLHVEVFDEQFPGETPEGAACLVAKLRGAVNRRFQGETTQPDCVMVDRGKGFYDPGNGKITAAFRNALQQHGFNAFWGNVCRSSQATCRSSCCTKPQ